MLLKGAVTHVCDPDGNRYAVTAPTHWLATAGSGDVLGGILGALVATHHARARDGCRGAHRARGERGVGARRGGAARERGRRAAARSRPSTSPRRFPPVIGALLDR